MAEQVPLDPQFEQRKADILVKADADSGPWECVFDRELEDFVISSLGPPPAPEIQVFVADFVEQEVANGGTAIMTGTSPFTIRIHNDGTVNLNFTGSPRVEVTGFGGIATGATITVQPATPVAPGGDSTATLEVTTFGDGIYTVNLSIASDDSDENPFTFTVQGLIFGEE